MSPEITYEGRRTENGEAVVTKGGKPLPAYHGVYNHSPDGFEWGYNGSGPAQLALALCCDLMGVDPRAKAPRGLGADVPEPMARALRVYQHLKSQLVAGLPHDSWSLPADVVRSAFERIERELAGR